MFTTIYHPFKSKANAKKVLTETRKRYRVALRGAGLTTDTQSSLPGVRVFCELDGTGFSNAELSSIFRCMESEICKADTEI